MTGQQQVTFASEFTYRTPEVTKTYPAGWSGAITVPERDAAQKAGALVEAKEPNNGDDGDGEPARGKGRARKTEG